jgi:Fe-S-cluster containining protein
MERCTGHCCKAFTLSGSYDELKARLCIIEDGMKIATMVIPLGEFLFNPETFEKYELATPLFTCKHLKQNGDCGIYLERPRMCSDYPYKGNCKALSCTLIGKRLKALMPCKKILDIQKVLL